MSSPSQSLSDVHTQSTSNLNSSGETGEAEETAEDSENVDVESQVNPLESYLELRITSLLLVCSL